MEGAVVVGLASGPGLAGATVTSAGPVTQVFSPAEVNAEDASPVRAVRAVPSADGGWAAGAWAVAAVMVVALAALSFRRHRRVLSS
jgi:choline-glycine betaine transporter